MTSLGINNKNVVQLAPNSLSNSGSPRPHRLFRTICCFLLVFELFSQKAANAQGLSREYAVKAVLLFNLAQFVDWPPGSFNAPNDPIVIGILGRDPFREILDNVVRGETVNGRKIIVKRFTSVRAAQKAHILFVCQSEEDNVDRIVSQLKELPILTVSDINNFARRGGMVRFFTNEENKIKLRINLDSVKQPGLGISSKLLRVSEVERSKT
ncbi:MAG: putative transrane protein [Verrucomicrobiales bacterium]|nr:putative transrane protein [Verrucomicrobiales bacterium]